MVCILVFVDQNVPEAALPIVAHFLILTQELDRKEQQIVKIHRAGGKHPAHVFRVDLTDLDAADVADRLRLLEILPCRDAAVLRAADLTQDSFVSKGFFIKIHVLDDLFGKALTVGCVIDREIAREAQLFRISAQHSNAGRVERAGPDIACLFAEHTLQPVL